MFSFFDWRATNGVERRQEEVKKGRWTGDWERGGKGRGEERSEWTGGLGKGVGEGNRRASWVEEGKSGEGGRAKFRKTTPKGEEEMTQQPNNQNYYQQ